MQRLQEQLNQIRTTYESELDEASRMGGDLSVFLFSGVSGRFRLVEHLMKRVVSVNLVSFQCRSNNCPHNSILL